MILVSSHKTYHSIYVRNTVTERDETFLRLETTYWDEKWNIQLSCLITASSKGNGKVGHFLLFLSDIFGRSMSTEYGAIIMSVTRYYNIMIKAQIYYSS